MMHGQLDEYVMLIRGNNVCRGTYVKTSTEQNEGMFTEQKLNYGLIIWKERERVPGVINVIGPVDGDLGKYEVR